MVCVFVLMRKIFIPLGVLIDELRCVKIASQRGRVYRAHEVDGNKLKIMLYIIVRLLRMKLLVAFPDSTDVACLSPVYSMPLPGSFRGTSMLLRFMCPMRRCHRSADSARKANSPVTPPSSTLMEHRSLPVISSAPKTFIVRTMSSTSNLGFPDELWYQHLSA